MTEKRPPSRRAWVAIGIPFALLVVVLNVSSALGASEGSKDIVVLIGGAGTILGLCVTAWFVIRDRLGGGERNLMARPPVRTGNLLHAYDEYIRDQARRPLVERSQALHTVSGPWWGGVLICAVLPALFGRWGWAVYPIGGLLMVGGIWVGARFHRYGAEYDSAAPDAPWATTAEAKVLMAALRRFAVGPIATLRLESRLQEERQMSAQDLTELFALLRQDSELDDRAVECARRGGLTIGELLESIHMPSASPENL